MKKFKIFLLNIKYENYKVIIYLAIISLIYALYGVNFLKTNATEVNFSFGDIYLFLFGGVPYDLKSIPKYINWFGFILLLYYPMIYFISNQFQDKKLFVFYRVKKYKYWYYANLVSTVLKTILVIITMYIVVFLVTLMFFDFNGTIIPNKFNNLINEISFNSLVFNMLLLNIMLVITIILITINLSFVIRDFNVATVSVLVITYLSSFVGNSEVGKDFVGNVAMVVRHIEFKDVMTGITSMYSYGFFSILIIINLILGHLLYRRNIEL